MRSRAALVSVGTRLISAIARVINKIGPRAREAMTAHARRQSSPHPALHGAKLVQNPTRRRTSVAPQVCATERLVRQIFAAGRDSCDPVSLRLSGPQVLASSTSPEAFAQASSGIAGCQGCVGRRASGRDGRGGESRTYREDPQAVTDGQGQFRIVGLVPGVYTVTFSLTGIQHVQARGNRTGQQLHGDGQRGPARRRDRGDDHRLGTEPGRGRVEFGRAQPDHS